MRFFVTKCGFERVIESSMDCKMLPSSEWTDQREFQDKIQVTFC